MFAAFVDWTRKRELLQAHSGLQCLLAGLWRLMHVWMWRKICLFWTSTNQLNIFIHTAFGGSAAPHWRSPVLVVCGPDVPCRIQWPSMTANCSCWHDAERRCIAVVGLLYNFYVRWVRVISNYCQRANIRDDSEIRDQRSHSKIRFTQTTNVCYL